MTTCPSFRESVKCVVEGDHSIAWGWTASTGQGGSYPYTPPTGWKFDPRYSDERGPTGSHGGCRTCIMTLVHLITTQDDLVPTPTPTPDTHPTSGTVIDRITRVGDVGEPGYSAYGQELRHCSKSGSQDDWHGATQGSLSGLLPTCYITEGVYAFLTDDEIESVRGRIRGIVPNSYAERKWTDLGYGSYWCWDFKDSVLAIPLPVPDPCAGVICENICIGADNYSQSCAEEGADAGKCVFGEIIEANYFECPGYVPPDPCEGIVCEPDCFGTSNKYETVCDEGICVIGAMIEENSVECGYVPPDPCKDIICEPECFGDDIHDTICEEGVCIKGMLTEANSAECGYVPPYDGIPDGTFVCFQGDILAKIGGFDGGAKYLMVDRSDNGPDVWATNFKVGICTPVTPGDEYPPKSELATDLAALFKDIKPIYIAIAIIVIIMLR